MYLIKFLKKKKVICVEVQAVYLKNKNDNVNEEIKAFFISGNK